MKISKHLFETGTLHLEAGDLAISPSNSSAIGSWLRVIAAHVKVMEDRIVELEAGLGNGADRILEPDGNWRPPSSAARASNGTSGAE